VGFVITIVVDDEVGEAEARANYSEDKSVTEAET